jgi:hypothetical protein
MSNTQARKEIAKSYISGVAFKFYATTGGDGRTTFPENTKPYGEISIGMDLEWPEVLGTLLHEISEACAIIMEITYQKDTSVSNDISSRWFFYDHAQHAEMCARIGETLKDVHDIYKQLWDTKTEKRFVNLRKTLDASIKQMGKQRKKAVDKEQPTS